MLSLNRDRERFKKKLKEVILVQWTLGAHHMQRGSACVEVPPGWCHSTGEPESREGTRQWVKGLLIGMRTERKGEEVSLSGPVIEESTSFGLELPKTNIRTPSALESVPHQSY